MSDCYVGMDQETDVVFAAGSSLEDSKTRRESFWLAPDDRDLSEFSEDEDAFSGRTRYAPRGERRLS